MDRMDGMIILEASPQINAYLKIVLCVFSALDSESEYYVKEALKRLMVGRTVITIAHRLSTIKTADQIAVLHEGRVHELGTYDQLTAVDDGIFRKLVEKQTITS